MRKLASIVTIKQIDDIEGKDRIGYLSFEENEWKVIGSKSFPIGSKVLYIEYDTILNLSFVNKLKEETKDAIIKRCFNAKYNGCKIGCMKMAKRVSYGIVFSLEELGANIDLNEWRKAYDGRDLSSKFGILKLDDDTPEIKKPKSFWEKLIAKILWKLFKYKKKSEKASWLSFIGKTDETRIQNFSHSIFEELKGIDIYSTVKIDGQSSTFAINKGKFYIATRNTVCYCEKLSKAKKDLIPSKRDRWQKYYGNNGGTFVAMACKYNLPQVMSEANFDLAIQCEQAGPGIQGNKLCLPDVELFMFNLFSIKTKGYYSWNQVKIFAERFKIKTVPFIEIRKFDFENVEQLEKYAKGRYNDKFHREGVVIRAYTEAYVPLPLRGMSNMLSFKVINPDYII